MDEESALVALKQIELDLMEYYDAWEERKCGRYMGDDDCIYILSEIRKLERQKNRIVSENPILLQKVW